jgi:hypothetical protein
MQKLAENAGKVPEESMQFCEVHYAANATASLPFAGRKPG